MLKNLKVPITLLILFISLNSSAQDLGLCCSCLENDTQANCQTECGNLPTPTYTYIDCPIDQDAYWLLGGAVLLGVFTITRKGVM